MSPYHHRLAGKIETQSALERFWLLVDFAEHGVREGGHRHSFRRGRVFIVRYPLPPSPFVAEWFIFNHLYV
jgi:hypothetical protein